MPTPKLLREAALLVCLVAGTGTARAGDWTSTDTAFELAFAALTATDVAQTRWFLTESPGATEANPLLGRHPSRAKLTALACASVSSHAIVAALLPPRYRRVWQLAGISVEVGAVAWNATTFGLHVKF